MAGTRIFLKIGAKLIVAIGLFLAFFGELALADQVFVDSAGRTVNLPDKIDRAMAAGPPASVLLYSLAPEKMVGWVGEPTAAEKEFLLPSVRNLPAYGRITGKGNTANIEVIISFKPDVIIDVGSVDPTYASLADRIQTQTGIPYVLIDGGFSKTPETLRIVGKLLNVTERAGDLAHYAETEQAKLKKFVEKIPHAQRPRVYYGRGPEGLETGMAGSINTEILEVVGAENVAAGAGTGSLANVSLEQILDWNPDFILTSNKDFFDTVRKNPL
jgi:iron complex transport system substrate-binding protein